MKEPMQIPPFKLVPEPMNGAARALPRYKWAGKDAGQRHQLGGAPSFLQEQDWPLCKHCENPMTFYAQLDSINDQFDLADCGMIYVFVCFDDFTVESFLHCH